MLLGAFLVAEGRDGLFVAEAALALEDGAPKFVKVTLLGLLLGRRVQVCAFVDRVVLTPLQGIEKDFVGFLDALEERVVFGSACGGPFVGMMLEYLLSMCLFDVFVCGLVPELRKTEDCIVVLCLRKVMSIKTAAHDLDATIVNPC